MRAILIVVILGMASAAMAEPNALVLVIDRSGSMQGPKLEAAKQAALAATSSLAPADLVAIVAFDSESKTYVLLTPSKNRVQIGKDLDMLKAGGGTNILPGLKDAAAILAGVKAKTKHVILLSDGEAPTDGIIELATKMHTDAVTISTVGVAGADEKLLKAISKAGGGRFYQVADLKQLSQTYVVETKLAMAAPKAP